MNKQVLLGPIVLPKLDALQLIGNSQLFEEPTRPHGTGSLCVVELERHRGVRVIRSSTAVNWMRQGVEASRRSTVRRLEDVHRAHHARTIATRCKGASEGGLRAPAGAVARRQHA